jgi:hypothetical protein
VNRFWRLSIQDISHLARVNHDSSRWYHVTQEWHFIDPELTLAKLRVKLVISQSLKHDSEMLFMFFHTLWIYKNVVNENHDKLVQLRYEYGVHEVYEVWQCIRQPKQHNKILIKTVSYRESHIGDIFVMNLNLMIAEAEINLGEHLSSR